MTVHEVRSLVAGGAVACLVTYLHPLELKTHDLSSAEAMDLLKGWSDDDEIFADGTDDESWGGEAAVFLGIGRGMPDQQRQDLREVADARADDRRDPKAFVVPIGTVRIVLTPAADGYCGTLSGSLDAAGADRDDDYAVALDAVERLLVALACEGVDPDAPAVVRALQTTLDGLAHSRL